MGRSPNKNKRPRVFFSKNKNTCTNKIPTQHPPPKQGRGLLRRGEFSATQSLDPVDRDRSGGVLQCVTDDHPPTAAASQSTVEHPGLARPKAKRPTKSALHLIIRAPSALGTSRTAEATLLANGFKQPPRTKRGRAFVRGGGRAGGKRKQSKPPAKNSIVSHR
jgi:hypothetical protein